MNAKDRIDAVVNLDIPDRVPVGPLLDHFAATYSGYTTAEIMRDGEKRIKAVLKTMKDLGPWDITFAADTANACLLKMGVPVRIQLPGKELPENEVHQFEEIEFLQEEDYDFFIKTGFYKFMIDINKRLYPEETRLQNLKDLFITIKDLRKHRKMIESSGSELGCSFIIPGTFFEYFSLGRGLVKTSLDIYDRPQKILDAGKIWAKAFTRLAIITTRIVGSKRIFIGISRTSPSLMSPKHFETFVLPELEYMVNKIVEAGFTPLLHCDTNWLKTLHLFKRFPKKKCILELDSFTDIFKAKEMLGDHMCLMGDVPATLQSHGTRDEVLSYCKKLIQEVGKGGGFILSSGCSIPFNAKPENVKAMREAVEKWGKY